MISCGGGLQLVKPFIPIIPQIKSPQRSSSLREKIIWTSLAVLIYLVLSQVPLFGVRNSESQDPLKWMRIIFASNRGTLMDLGISSVVSASTIIDVLNNFDYFKANFEIKEDKNLQDCLGKIITIVLTLGQAILQIVSGYYGPFGGLGYGNSFVILFQLFFAGIIVLLLDDILFKGYGFGNGVNLFIVANLCERLVWNAVSPKVFYAARGMEFEGSLIALFHLLIVSKNNLAALYEVLFRENLPNLSSLISTLTIFCFIVYMQSIRVDIPLISRKLKGVTSSYPINLLYASTTPVTRISTVTSVISMFSRFFFDRYPDNKFVRAFGIWDFKHNYGYVPVGGLCYFIFPPTSVSDVFKRPIFFIIYMLVNLVLAAFMSKSHVDSSIDSSESVFEKLKSNDMQLRGVRDTNSVEKINEYVSIASFLGGMITSLIINICDIVSTVGSGSNIFLTASILNQFIKLLAKESARKMGKAFID